MSPQDITVYIQYPKGGDTRAINQLSQSLKSKRYIVPPSEEMGFEFSYADIRFYQEGNRAPSEELRRQISHITGINLKVKDLGRQYPNVRNGVIEVWIPL